MQFFFKQRKPFFIYDLSETYAFSSFKQKEFLHLVILNFSLKRLESQKTNLSKNRLTNLQLKALLLFYIGFGKYSFFNFKNSKVSSGYAFKIILGSFISINLFLNFLLINNKLESIINIFKKIRNDALITTNIKYLNLNLFFKAPILFINTDLFSNLYKNINAKNFFITVNILFKNNKLFISRSIKNFYLKNLFLDLYIKNK
jgi:hypothetical protein